MTGAYAGQASSSLESVKFPTRIVFLDSAVENYGELAQATLPGIQVKVLDRESDEISQITAALTKLSTPGHPVASVYIVSHGEPGALWLGRQRITAEGLGRNATDFKQWRQALAPQADIMLYGCEVAGNQPGRELMARLAKLTGAQVAASTDLTGATKLGGNWRLEAQTGNIQSPGPFRAGLKYNGVLAINKTFNPPPSVFVRPGGTSYRWNFSTGTTPDANFPGSYPVTSVGYYNVAAFNWVVTRGHFEYSSNGGSTWTTYTLTANPVYISNTSSIWRFVDTTPADTTNANSFGVSWNLQGPTSSVQTGSSVVPDNPPTDITSDKATIFATAATGANVATLTPVDTGSTLNGYWTLDSQSVPNLFTLSFNTTNGNTAILKRGTGVIPAVGQTATVSLHYYDLYQTDTNGNPIAGQGFSKTLTYTVVSETSADLNFGSDLGVNTYTNNDQSHPAVATLSNGNFVTVWHSAGQNGKSVSPTVNHGIYGQIYSSPGVKVGSEFVISSSGSAVDEISPAVTALNSGRFAVAYCTAGTNYDVAFRIVEANGTVGTEHSANTTRAENQYNPFMATLTNGNFVIIWNSDNGDVKLQQFSPAAGATVGSETTIVSAGGLAPGIAALDTGGYVTTWVDGTTYDVMVKVGSGTAVDTGIYWSGYGIAPRVAGLAGGFVVAGEHYNTNTQLSQIDALRYNNAGVAQGALFRVNNNTAGNRYSASLTTLSTGGFLVAWVSDTDDYDLNGVFGRRYAANGTAVDASEFEINQHRLDDQSLVAVTALSNNLFAAAWTMIPAASIADSSYIGDVKARVLLPSNLAPTDVALSASSVNQSAGINATVGTLTSTDADSAAFTYTLVSGTGATDNSAFNISGATLRANNAAALSGGNHSVRIQTDDGSGGTFAKAFTITVVDDIQPAAPTAFSAHATGSNVALGWTNPTNADFASVTIRRSTVSFPATNTSGTLVAQGITGTSSPDNGLPDGTYYYSIFALDGAGNVSVVATASVLVDTLAPTVAISAPSASFTKGGPISFTATWSDANFNSSSISLQANQVTVNTTGTVSVGSVSVSGSGNTRTVQLSAISGDGTVGISLPSNTGSDLAGNNAGGAGPSATATVDNTAPTVSIGAPSASATASGPVSYTITYTAADAVTLASGDITLNKTGSANGTVGVSGSGTGTRTVTISSITGSGTLGISLAAGTASDTAGNAALAAGPSPTFVVNSAPTVASDNATITVGEGATASNTGTFADADGNATVTLSASVGTVTPNAGAGTWAWSFHTTDGPEDSQTVTITADDGVAAPVTTTFTLAVTNLAPTAVAQSVTTPEDTATNIVLTASDPGLDAITNWVITVGPTNGTLSGTAPNLTYLPGTNYNGSDSFQFTATDSDGAVSASALVSLTVTPVNDAPVAGTDSLARLNNTKVVKVTKAVLLANDTDADNDPLTISAVGNATPTGATVAIAGTFVIYTAPSTNAGDGSFTYTLSDGPGGHAVVATVPVVEVATVPSGAGPNYAQIAASGSDYVLTFIGVPTRQYRVQYTTSLASPYTWNEFSPLAVLTAPTNGVFNYTDVNPSGPIRLYRAVPHP